jgi:cyclic beta-1,2-glucan synthetase
VDRDPRLPDAGFGAFAAGGTEYVIRLDGGEPAGGRRPPMPWVNVVSNPRFGLLVSESGATCTWSRNSRQHKLTPWTNDPVADPHGEALWVRDEAAGVFWSPQPGPVPAAAPYEVRHGLGYTRWRHASHALDQDVWLFAAAEDPVRVAWLELENLSEVPRELSLFAYQRLVLGATAAEHARLVTTELDARSGILLARGHGDEQDGEVAFAAAAAPPGASVSLSADRNAFLGPGGSPELPAALFRAGDLDGRAGPGLDACFALQVRVRVPAHGRTAVAFLLGEATDVDAARALVARYRSPGAVPDALGTARDRWRELCSAVQVETPCAALDAMLNGWLVYQTLSCRLWGRSAFYQSGGAFGFRDQLQDAAALVWWRPDLTRAQILLHAAHQFAEGDVLHWWHPPSGRGTRTRFSDDLLWLPWVAAHYLRVTGDAGLLDETAGFVAARALAPGEEEAFLAPRPAAERASVFEHCARAIDRSLGAGARGLPLMGTGDWNDGMNRVGREGRGESVWLGFFLHEILGAFAPLAEARGERERARRWRERRASLASALEQAGWDGGWYRRAYYDDGTPLGAASSDECQIDALAQAWAVISGIAPPARAKQSLDAMEARLVAEADGLIRLLAPPFDRTAHDPGYIKGYVPGVRENGGQYTHAALWAVQALAEAGRHARAARLLEMLSPVSHARSPEAARRYKVEPYVIAADVYGAAPHVGRGGWTWYTGSAGWMLRVVLETLLGCRLEDGRRLVLRPRLPASWPEVELRWRLPDGTIYHITMVNQAGGTGALIRATLDGRPLALADGAARLPLEPDGREHTVRLEFA